MTIALLILLAVIAAIFYLHYRLRHLKDQGDLAAALDKEMQKATKNFSCGGLVVGVYKQGKTLIKTHGSINSDQPNRPDVDSVFQIGSVSKVFTASTLQILCDEGVLRLDDTLGQLIGGQIPLADAVKNINLRQLATHTSGLPRVPKVLMQQLNNKVGKQHALDNPYNELELADMLAYLQNPSDLGKAGRFVYSNYGMGLLGRVLELAAGQDLETLVAKKIFQPLKMQHSGIDLTKENPSQVMQGYTAACKPAQAWTFKILAGAGAFYSTATAMLQFIRANLDPATPLSASLNKTHTPQASGKTGLGWMQANPMDRFVGNKTVIWHDGQVGGFASYLAFDSEHDCGVVILSSRSMGMNMLGMMLMRQLRSQSWAG